MRHPQTVVANDGVAANGPITADNPDFWLTGNDGMPLSLSNPTHITVGLAPVGTTIGGVTVSNVLDTQEITLLKAATQIWESLANVQFQLVDSSTTVPDISVGLADLNSMQLIGYTQSSWNSRDQFLPGTLTLLEDPAETSVTTLENGDLRYNGLTTTMLQVLEHELGHALGLGHNQVDIASIMHPVIGANDPVPDANDIVALQSVYGAPSAAPVLSAGDLGTLHALLANTNLNYLA